MCSICKIALCEDTSHKKNNWNEQFDSKLKALVKSIKDEDINSYSQNKRWFETLPTEADSKILKSWFECANYRVRRRLYSVLLIRRIGSKVYNREIIKDIFKMLKKENVSFEKKRVLIKMLGLFSPLNNPAVKNYLESLVITKSALKPYAIFSLVRIGFFDEYETEVASLIIKNEHFSIQFSACDLASIYGLRGEEITKSLYELTKTKEKVLALFAWKTLAKIKRITDSSMLELLLSNRFQLKDKVEILRECSYVLFSKKHLIKLLSIFKKEKDIGIRMEIAGILVKHNMFEGVKFLTLHIQDSKGFVFERALELAGKSKNMNMLNVLFPALIKKDSAYVKISRALTNLTLTPCYEESLKKTILFWAGFVNGYQYFINLPWNAYFYLRVDFLVRKLQSDFNEFYFLEFMYITAHYFNVDIKKAKHLKKLDAVKEWWKLNFLKPRREWVKNGLLLICDDLFSKDDDMRWRTNLLLTTYVPSLPWTLMHLSKSMSKEEQIFISKKIKSWIYKNPDMLMLDNTWESWPFFSQPISPKATQ